VKKQNEKKLVLKADRIRDLTPDRLSGVIGGALSPGGSGSTEDLLKKPPTG